MKSKNTRDTPMWTMPGSEHIIARYAKRYTRDARIVTEAIPENKIEEMIETYIKEGYVYGISAEGKTKIKNKCRCGCAPG